MQSIAQRLKERGTQSGRRMDAPVVVLVERMNPEMRPPGSQSRTYKGSVETRKHMARDNEGVKALLTELGLAR